MEGFRAGWPLSVKKRVLWSRAGFSTARQLSNPTTKATGSAIAVTVQGEMPEM
jgi:glutamine cyclotransferase